MKKDLRKCLFTDDWYSVRDGDVMDCLGDDILDQSLEECAKKDSEDLTGAERVELFQNEYSDLYRQLMSDKTYNTYIITDSSGMVKIGKAKSIDNRMKTYKTHNPTTVLVAVIFDDVEAQLHDMLKDKRVEGEWFTLTHDELALFIQEISRTLYLRKNPKYEWINEVYINPIDDLYYLHTMEQWEEFKKELEDDFIDFDE